MPTSDNTTLFVVAVAVIIQREGNLLAMRRALSKDAGPGLWEALSGRLELHETPLAAATREVLEECGLTVNIAPRPLTAYPASRLGKPMIVIVYAADYQRGEVVLSAEHDAYDWLTPTAFAARSTLTPLIQAAHQAFSVSEHH